MEEKDAGVEHISHAKKYWGKNGRIHSLTCLWNEKSIFNYMGKVDPDQRIKNAEFRVGD